MRKLSTITATILPPPLRQRSYDRRPVRAVFNSLICLAVVRHDENDAQLFVSCTGDEADAVWVKKAQILVDPKDRGPFLVITLTRMLAQEKNLSTCIIDWDRYTPEQQLMLKDAVECARRSRERMSGQSSNRPTWNGGRNVYA